MLLAEILFNGAKFILIDEAYYIYSMPSGPSGRSPHSRTVYDVGKLPDTCDMLSTKVWKSHRCDAQARDG